jgi:hypothetical protein
MFASHGVTRFAATGLGLAALSTAATASAVTSPDDDFGARSATKPSPTTRRGWLSRMPSTCAAPSTTVPIRST